MKPASILSGLIFLAGTLAAPFLDAQTPPDSIAFFTKDSLSFGQVVSRVLTSYPSVLKAREAIHSTEAAIGLAKSGYYPNIFGDASYTHLGPVSEISFPGFGTFQLFPANNYNASVTVDQTVWDFSKTARNVKLQESGKELAEKNVEMVKQRLTLLTAISYYTLVYLQDAIKIKDLQLETLKKHLDFVTTKEQTGSSTQYEILSTQVRYSSAENQKVDLQTSQQTQLAILNSLLGLPGNTQLVVRNDLGLKMPEVSPDSLISFALEHRYEMIMARLREKHAELNLRAVKVQENPVLNAFASGGWKNGYIPDLNTLTANYVVGIGLHVPIFDATRRKNNIRMANSEISMTRHDLEQTTRDISSEVYQNQAGLEASLKKIEQCRLQVRQAEDALALAAVSFKAGVITNLDLLDAESAEEQSRLDLLKATVDYAIDVVRLDISLGRPIQ